jgi:segregation and condensation protein A
VAVIFNFLAILELLQSSLISITVGEGFNNFWLEKVEQEAE